LEIWNTHFQLDYIFPVGFLGWILIRLDFVLAGIFCLDFFLAGIYFGWIFLGWNISNLDE